MIEVVLPWLFAYGLCFCGLCLAGGSVKERRPHFWLRVLLLAPSPLLPLILIATCQQVGLLPSGTVTGTAPILYLLTMASLMFSPAVLYHRSSTPPGPGESDGGGGGGPDQPPLAPTPPGGGIPLDDADQAAARVRDHTGPRFGGVRPRRPAREPGPARRVPSI